MKRKELNNNEKKKQQRGKKTLKKTWENNRKMHLPYMDVEVATCFQRYLYLRKLQT